jgi:hypothetical protein
MALASSLKRNLRVRPRGSAIAQKYLLVAQLALRLAIFTSEGVVRSPIFRKKSIGRIVTDGNAAKEATIAGVFVGGAVLFFA